MRVPKVLDRFANPISPIGAYIASPFCVAAVAWAVERLQRYIEFVDGRTTHPNLIAFLLPMVLLTVIGGRGPGILTLLLSGFVSLWILIDPKQTFEASEVADAIGLALMLLTGCVLILGLDLIRNAALIHTHFTEQLARVHERSLRIAAAFQAPLIPRIAGRTPGLEAAHYYKPVLDEAMVGGDFLDAFDTARGHSVLVLGDISGKGLNAAAQVSTVKNIVRFALNCKEPSELAAVVTEINQTIASQGLLSAFATLFVAIYDPGTRKFRYVSCGHEPALLRPASGGGIEELPPTGPILGAFAGSVYTAVERVLEPGDTLVVYTDGLSDSGPDRRNMLGTIGLKQLFDNAGRAPVAPSAQELVDAIIAGTQSHAEGKLSDDACLLVCTVLPESEPTPAQSAEAVVVVAATSAAEPAGVAAASRGMRTVKRPEAAPRPAGRHMLAPKP